MSLFPRIPGEEKYFPGIFVKSQQHDKKCLVNQHNIQFLSTDNTTTIYIVSDDANDAEQLPASFFFMPTPLLRDHLNKYYC